MLEEQQLTQFKSILENAQTVVILVSDHPSVDEAATAIGLHLALREMGKESRLAAVIVPQFSNIQLPGIEQVTTELGNQNLTISFDYKEEQVDKVSYHIGEDTQKFYLTIKPRSGAQPLDTNTVEFSYTGAAADVLIYVGINALEDLQQLYYGYEDLYQNATAISISQTPTTLGLLQLSPQTESSVSELLTRVFSTLQFPISPDTATNWLAGIEFSTKGLTEGALSGDTFESIATLLRAGGIRQSYVPPTPVQRTNGKTEVTINKNNSDEQRSSENSSKKQKKQRPPLSV